MEAQRRAEAESAGETKEEVVETGEAASGEGLYGASATAFSGPGTWTMELVNLARYER